MGVTKAQREREREGGRTNITKQPLAEHPPPSVQPVDHRVRVLLHRRGEDDERVPRRDLPEDERTRKERMVSANTRDARMKAARKETRTDLLQEVIHIRPLVHMVHRTPPTQENLDHMPLALPPSTASDPGTPTRRMDQRLVQIQDQRLGLMERRLGHHHPPRRWRIRTRIIAGRRSGVV